MDTGNQRQVAKERASRHAIGSALEAAYPVDPVSSFNPEVAGLLARLDDFREAEQPWRGRS